MLILQHPKESRNPISTVPLIPRHVEGCVRKVGLSWRSLRNALGREADARRWVVLYLGTVKTAREMGEAEGLQVVDRAGHPQPLSDIEGIILLDGNWKQSKALWWRNPWLLKLNRAVLNPAKASAYSSVRQQPRRQCLSTIEATSEALRALGEVAAADALDRAFRQFMQSPPPVKAPTSPA